MKHMILFLPLVILFALPALAQESPRQDLDGFYRPQSSANLVTKLAPRGSAGEADDANGFFSGRCPDQINIGGVVDDGDSPFSMNTTVETVVTKPITIVCR